MGRKDWIEKGRKERRNEGKGLRINNVRWRLDFKGKEREIEIGKIGKVEEVEGEIGKKIKRKKEKWKLRSDEWKKINKRREEKED